MVASAQSAPSELSPEAAVERLRSDEACVVDVRSGLEYRTEHVPGSLHVPLDELSAHVDEIRDAGARGPLLLLCRTGVRAGKAQQALTSLGVTGTHVVQRGIEGWRSAGGETVAGEAGMSLERQVRIAAGTLGLTGVVLGFVVHQGFFFLSGFVSAGLIFAGITDWCGMGLLLARMPWNRGGR